MNKSSKISFIIPTLNSADRLPACLDSVLAQDLPGNQVEILVADGGSTDQTKNLARASGATVLDNPSRDAESGKAVGLKAAHGDYVVLLDSDDVLVERSWAKTAMRVLDADTGLFGIEPYYEIADDFTWVNAYCNLLFVTTDPLARFISPRRNGRKTHDWMEYRIEHGEIHPVGANGFIWRKSVLDKHGFADRFEEGNFSANLKSGRYARIDGVSIYHYYVRTLADFIRKRIKIGRKFLNRRHRHSGDSWVDRAGRGRAVLGMAAFATILWPLAEGIFNAVRTRRVAWLAHPLMCWLTFATYAGTAIEHILTPVDKRGTGSVAGPLGKG